MSWLTDDDHIWHGTGLDAAFAATDKGVYDPSLPIRFQTDRLGSEQTMAAIRNSGRRRRPFGSKRLSSKHEQKLAILDRLEFLLTAPPATASA